MKSRIFILIAIMGSLLLRVHLFAQDSAATPKIEWMGMAALEEGQFIKCNYAVGPMTFRPWLTDEFARLGVKGSLNRHFSITVIPQFELWNDTYDWTIRQGAASLSDYAATNPLIQHATVSLADAECIAALGSGNAPAFKFAAGVIPIKYDMEAKNLGEYLFRTGEHPAYIFNSFDQAYATLTGFRANAEFRNFSADLFFTTETQVQPVNDWSLSLLLGYKLPGFFDVGAGIMFDRLIPAVPFLDKPGYLNTYLTSSGQLDTFSWGGTKVMGRLSFDPKGFLPSDMAGLFGKEDGIIYSEAAILGLTNVNAYTYPFDSNSGQYDRTRIIIDSAHNYYGNILQRIPVMFGINIPTCSPLLKSLIGFGILDYLSAEFEYYGDPFDPGTYTMESFQYILPRPNGEDPAISHWKYSFNLRETIWDHFTVIGQIARDHTRHDIFYVKNMDANEIFETKDEWGWWLKLQYNL